jgi:hypothetical protein
MSCTSTGPSLSIETATRLSRGHVVLTVALGLAWLKCRTDQDEGTHGGHISSLGRPPSRT